MPTKPRVLIACTACRSHHLKCDAAQPKCSRCISANRPCVYKDLRRRPNQPSPDSSIQDPSPPTSIVSDIIQISNIDHLAFAANRSTALDSFYTYFYPSHPFVLPQSHLQLYDDQDSLKYLLEVIEFIGACYNKQCSPINVPQDLPPSLFNVQALLLFAMALEWSGDERAAECLSRCISMALQMNLHCNSFTSSITDSVLAESCRRTWWELYIVDAFFAGIRHQPTFTLFTTGTDASLPNETYTQINASQTLQDYDDRAFNDSEFSSYAYLVDAARILGTVLAAGDISHILPMELVRNAQANILSWHLHLPTAKKDPVSSAGSVDEVLFRAHLLIQTVSIHLHRPRSQLHYSTMELLCSPYAPPLPAEILPSEERLPNHHTQKAIAAAKQLIDFLSVPSAPIQHTPFVMCMGSMAMATHLSACQFLLHGTEYTYAKDRVRVFLGVLKSYDGIWKQSEKWSNELKFMAKAVFDNQPPAINFDEIQTLIQQ